MTTTSPTEELSPRDHAVASPPRLAATLASRYAIVSCLGKGAMGAVYRAHDRLTGHHVALKRVTVDPARIALASSGVVSNLRLRLAEEFRTLASLRHPNVISVLDYGFDEEQRPYFTMELIEEPRTLLEAGRGGDARRKVELLTGVLQALAYLHRRGVLHRDIKPDNVLVTPSGQVKVLDFGLALALEGAGDEVAGTPAYMAPEVLLGGRAVASSDLYAVGVMAYELFAERHPFGASARDVRLMNVLRASPELGCVRADPGIVALIQRLLAKKPAERPESAALTLRLLAEASGLSEPRDTIEIRESFLQAARFVGREDELGALTLALSRTLDGDGSTWLIGGESGVGKSRLVDELRIRALVQSVPVLRGQGVRDGARPLHIWGEILRPLVLTTPLGDLAAGVLKPLVPDIAVLLGRPVPDAPEIEAASAHERLLHAIDGVLDANEGPRMLILEDLQWEGPDSLTLIGRAMRHRGLMILGTYRDDETPHLPRGLAGAELMRLERLREGEIAALAESMLGSAGRSPELVRFLERETEGNVFFVVEVVRALAERAGALAEVGLRAPTESVFPGGMREVMERRLARVPVDTRRLLSLAAVAGDRIDERLLSAAVPDGNVEAWLVACTDAAVLAAGDGFRFAHHKLRETVLAGLGAAERRALHIDVATAIERAYEDAALFAADLAHHYREGGDSEKAARYALVVGRSALEGGATEDAVPWLREAITGEAHLTELERVRAYRLLAEALFALGRFVGADEAALHAASLAGWPPLSITPRVLFGAVGHVLLHLAYRLFRFTMPRPPHPMEVLYEGGRGTMVHAWCIVFRGQMLIGVFEMIRGFNVLEVFRGMVDYARGAAVIVYILRMLRLRRLAERYEQDVRAMRPAIPDALLPHVLLPIAYSHANEGRFAQALAYIEEGTAAAQRIGDDIQWALHRASTLAIDAQQGTIVEARHAELERVGRRSGNDQFIVWALVYRILVYHLAGQTDAALASAAESQERAERSGDFNTLASLTGILPLLWLCAGDRDKAVELARRALPILKAQPILLLFGIDGPRWLVQACYGLGLQREAREALKVLRTTAYLIPIARPRVLLWDGKLNARPRRLREALAEAERFGMPFDQALALRAMGESARADAILRGMGATYYLSDQPGARLLEG